MYTAFYGLREKPFALSPNPRFLFLSESHREALAHLSYGVEQREGFIAVTGEVGTGKTTLCRTLIERLGPDTEVAYLFNPSRNAQELMEAIASELALPSAGLTLNQLHDQLNEFLLTKSGPGGRVLLIVDEAQNLSVETLEQVRLLSNLETSSSKLIQILLLGQPELDRKLDSRELRQLAQRIGVRWSLSPLSAEGTRRYVAYRLRVAAGAERDIFTRGALREIHRRTQGIPRLINVLCDRALLAGYAAKSKEIDARTVRQAAREIEGGRAQTVEPARPRRWWPWAAAAGVATGVAFALVAGTRFGGDLERRLHERFGAQETPIRSQQAAEPDPVVIASVDGATAIAPRAVGDEVGPGLGPVAATPDFLSGLRPIVPLGLDPHAPDSAIEPTPAVSSPAAVSPAAMSPAAMGSAATEVLRPIVPAPAPIEIGIAQVETGGPLEHVLARSDALEARRRAANAVLESFGEPPLSAAPEDEAHLVRLLEWSGLSVLPIPAADFGILRALNHPAILSLEAADGQPRDVALMGLDGVDALLRDVGDGSDLRVRVSELRSPWDGHALVVWRAFDRLPEVVGPGEEGEPVIWLQAALETLGYYEGPVSGVFDDATRDGLTAFQRGRHLEPDGAAGPRTKMVLYDLLGHDTVPRLSDSLRAGGGAG